MASLVGGGDWARGDPRVLELGDREKRLLMRAAKWICLLIGAFRGAGLWPLLAWLVVAIDEGHVDPSFGKFVFPVWILVGMPGVVVEARGYLTLAFLMAFWGAVGAGIARMCFHAYECLLSMIAMRKEAPFGDRREGPRVD